MLAEALEHLVRGVVDHPDEVVVREKQLRRGALLEVRVNPEDLGRVIGRGGRTATAFRTVLSALAGRDGARIDFVDTARARVREFPRYTGETRTPRPKHWPRSSSFP